MNKKVLSLLIILNLFLGVLINTVYSVNGVVNSENTISKTLSVGSNFESESNSAVLIEAKTGKVLYEKNIHEKLQLASVTKIMSMLLLMEGIDEGRISFEDSVTISEHAYSMGGSQVYLEPGEMFSVHELLKAVAIHSANDATVALAEFVAGSEDLFVARMNEKAKMLGMNNTNFLDASGLTDEGHYSTAYDIAIMSRELILKHPKILDYTRIVRDSFRNGEFDLDTTNQLLKTYKGLTGLKTGFTSKAGFCLSATAKREDLELIAVVLGESNSKTRNNNIAKLLDYGFANYEVAQLNKKGDILKSLNIKKGIESDLVLQYAEDVDILLKRGEKNKIQIEEKINSEIFAPIKEGDKVGNIVYKVDNVVVGEVAITAQNSIEKASMLGVFTVMLEKWFSLGREVV